MDGSGGLASREVNPHSRHKQGTKPADGGGDLSGFERTLILQARPESLPQLTLTRLTTLSILDFFCHCKLVITVPWHLSRRGCRTLDIMRYTKLIRYVEGESAGCLFSILHIIYHISCLKQGSCDQSTPLRISWYALERFFPELEPVKSKVAQRLSSKGQRRKSRDSRARLSTCTYP